MRTWAALALTIDKVGYYGTDSDRIRPASTPQSPRPDVQAELVEMETCDAVDNADVSGMGLPEAGSRGYAKTVGVAGNDLSHQSLPGTEITNQVNKGDVIMGNFADLLVAMGA